MCFQNQRESVFIPPDTPRRGYSSQGFVFVQQHTGWLENNYTTVYREKCGKYYTPLKRRFLLLLRGGTAQGVSYTAAISDLLCVPHPSFSNS
jgi:hypothetical protein